VLYAFNLSIGGFMQRVIICLFIAFFALCSAYPSKALAKANPSLTAFFNDDDRTSKSGVLSFKSLEVKVDVVGGVTQTYIEAEIYNNADEEVEGEFSLRMPDGAVINHYALDIEGQLVSGVLTKKELAERAYSDRVAGNIDPGLAKLGPENIYKTRIFPIPSEESRKIALGFVTLITQEDFQLDLKTDSEVGVVKLTVPYSETSLRDNPSLSRLGVAEYFSEKARLKAQVTIPLRRSKNVLTRHESGQSFYSFGLTQTEQEKLFTGRKFSPKTLRIYWDHSLSRANDDHAAERGVLRSFLRNAALNSVELITATDHITSQNVFAGDSIVESVDGVLLGLDYDGGSDLSALLGAGQGQVDSCIFVSDGHSTIGSKKRLSPSCPVYSLSSSANMNQAMLNMLARESGGYVITDTTSRQKALKLLKQSPQGQMLASNVAGVTRLGQGPNTVFVIPLRHDMPDIIKLSLADQAGKSFKLERNLANAEFIDHSGIGGLWASSHAESLRARGFASASDIVDFSRPFNIAGPESALLVLEETSDYIESGITPPKNFPAQQMEDYLEELAEFNQEKAENRADRLSDIIAIWEDQIKWWAKDYSRKKDKKHSEDVHSVVPPPPAQVATPAPVVSDQSTARFRGVENDHIIVTGSRRKSTIDIGIRKWSPDRAYLTDLKVTNKENFESVYRKQRSTFGDLPAFYLEVADLLFQSGNKTRASQVVLGALELPSANADTQTLVAHRLLMYGEFDRAIELYEKALDASVERPQPYYNLAVALIDRANANNSEGDLLLALGHLDYIIRNVWDGDDDGIELVALMEANAAIKKLPKKLLHEVTLDKALIKNLDVDLRIVMDWNVDNADIDLWVTEPSGEKASYSNQLTLSGGQVSNDMTDGYGPEQYLLRRAVNGKFVIRSDLYSSDAYNPNGAIGIRARVIKDFGRPKASFETIIIELSEKGEDEFVVGEYIVK